MKKKLFTLIILIFISFFNSEAYATGFNFGGLGPGQSLTNDSNCINDPKGPQPKPPDICSNSSSRTSTTCSGESPCIRGGDLWSKYRLLGCAKDESTQEIEYYWTYDFDEKICSTADKCDAGPYLNAGFCSCAVGATYKTCCSGAIVSTNSCVRQSLDTTNPPYEGVCPAGTTTVPCGSDPSIYAEMGYEFKNVACGQAACQAFLATPTPTPTGTRLSCSNPDCGTGGPAVKLTNGNWACTDQTTTPKCYACSGSGGSCASDPTGQLNTSTCDNKCKACPTTGGWTGEVCTTPNATRSKTCASDPNTCNKCSLGYCLEAKKNPSLYCWFDNPTCVTDPNKCAGFGTCGTGATGCTDEQGAKYPIGSIRTRCSAQNACTIPQ